MVVHRHKLRETLSRLCRVLAGGRKAAEATTTLTEQASKTPSTDLGKVNGAQHAAVNPAAGASAKETTQPGNGAAKEKAAAAVSIQVDTATAGKDKAAKVSPPQAKDPPPPSGKT